MTSLILSKHRLAAGAPVKLPLVNSYCFFSFIAHLLHCALIISKHLPAVHVHAFIAGCIKYVLTYDLRAASVDCSYIKT